jgi:hypothetical protein
MLPLPTKQRQGFYAVFDDRELVRHCGLFEGLERQTDIAGIIFH